MVNEKVKFFSLGGLDEIGKNLFILEIKNNIYILDAGSKYPSNNIPGVDLIIPSFKYLEENKSRVKAYIISHGHQENIGALIFMYKRIPAPIYCTKFTSESIIMLDKAYETNNKFVFELIDNCKEKMIGNVKFGFSNLTHSIPGAVSIKAYTDQGIICYIADFICDPSAKEPFQTDYKNLEFGHEGNYLALILGCENSTRKGYTIPKHHVSDLMLRHFENSQGKIFVINIKQNLFNLQEIFHLCDKFNKTVFVYEKKSNTTAPQFYQKAFLEYKICSQKTKFGKLSEINRTREQDIVVLFLEERKDVYETIQEFGESKRFEYRIDITTNDLFIDNTQPIPTKETKATQILDLLYKTNAQVFQISKKERNILSCSEEDIKQFLTFLQPKYFIPVSGYYFQLMTAAKIALNSSTRFNYSNIFLLDNGVPVEFENKMARPDYKNKIECANLFIDGIDIGNVGNNVVEERSRMSNDGIVLMAITVSKTSKEIVGGPDVQMRGFVFLKDSENILREITNIFVENVRVFLTGFYDDKEVVINNIIEKATRYVRRETGKNPLIIPEIVELD